MKDPEIPVAGFQDAGGRIPEVLPEGMIITYHTHGYRQYMGTAKYHYKPDCPHLWHWKPESHVVQGRVARLSKTIMREALRPEEVPRGLKCKTCWPKT